MSTETTPISPAEAVELRLQQLKIVLDGSISYRLETIFPDATRSRASRQIERTAKLIQRVEPALKRVLLHGEQVLYVAAAESADLARREIVATLTNARMLLMGFEKGGDRAEMVWSVYYSQIKKCRSNWLGLLTLELVDKTEAAFRFTAIDRRSIATISNQMAAEHRRLEFIPIVSQSRERLCRECLQVAPKGKFDCEHCGMKYWRPSELALRSLVFPLWGEFSIQRNPAANFGRLLAHVGCLLCIVCPLMAMDLRHGVVSLIFEHLFAAALIYRAANDGLIPRRQANSAETHDASTLDTDDGPIG